MILSSAAASALLAIAPAALAAEWSVSEDATFYIDATVTHTATPDSVHMSVDCQIMEPISREAIRAEQKEYMNELSIAAGEGAKIRRGGAPTLYAYTDYDPETGRPVKVEPATYSGNFGYSVILANTANAEALAAAVEEMGCTYTWDPRLVYTGKYARENRAELVKQINEKKEFYEEVLGIKLTQVSNVSISTYVDFGGGYYGSSSPYDPEANSVSATTTMSITFDLPKSKKD